MNEYILTIDCGTQSIRAIIFDKKGKMIHKVKENFEPYFSDKPGYAEQHVSVYFDSLCRVTNQVKKENREAFDKIIGVSLTTQRDTCVCMDKNHEVLRPAIVWMDQRKLKEMKPMKWYYNVITKLVGMYETAHKLSISCAAHWIEKHQPEIWDKTTDYVMLSGYLNYLLCGELVDNAANQVGHVPFDHKRFTWEKPYSIKSQFFQIDRDKFIPLKDPATQTGNITKEASLSTGIKEGLPFISAGSDKACETIGVGCLDNDVVSVSLGSQASVQTTSSKYYEAIPIIPPFMAAIPGRYNPEIQIYRGYWMISWFKEQFAQKEIKDAILLGTTPEKLLNKRLHEIPPGSEGLILQPYWGSGIKTPEAKGSIIGFSDVHTKTHIYRAIIEGIGYGLFEGVKAIEKKSKVKVKTVMLSGGGSQSDGIAQITADMFNRQVKRVQTYETSGLGAAIVGFIALGKFSSFEEAVKEMVHESKTFYPDEKNAKIYDDIYHNIYKKIYKKLHSLYKKMTY
ncbi:MAG: FGGY-family carbohydrate kinase [Clostridiales bacterium]|nr:FGGY-family carbohydrate kinase [Clostridiales bacterium]